MVINKSVWVIKPTYLSSKVNLRSIFFCIQTVLPGEFRICKNHFQSFRTQLRINHGADILLTLSLKNLWCIGNFNGYCFPLIRSNIKKCPEFGFGFSQINCKLVKRNSIQSDGCPNELIFNIDWKI
jgi:hypothetical protein